MKKNNKNKQLFSFIATISIACSYSLLVLSQGGMRTDIVIWVAIFWMLIVGAGAALTIFDQPDKPRGPISWHGWGDSMTGVGGCEGGCGGN
jgi:hypothetical protein